MTESPSNKYLTNLQEAIEQDATALIAIFKPVMESLAALDAADISPEAKHTAEKRAKKYVQDVYAAIPNQYKPVVQDLVQQALFPSIAEPSPLLVDSEPEQPPATEESVTK